MFPTFQLLTEKDILNKQLKALPDADLSKLATRVLPPGLLRDVALKTLKRLATPSLILPATLGSGGGGGATTHKKMAAESDVFLPLKPRDFPVYDPVYLEETDLWRLHSGQYEYLVFPVPEESRRFLLLCFKHDLLPISVLIDKWHGSLRVTQVALDRMPEKWFLGSLFHGFVKNTIFRIYNLAAYNDQSTSDENSLYRFDLAGKAYRDYLSCPVVFPSLSPPCASPSALVALKVEMSPCSLYPDMPKLNADELKHWKPRAYWLIPGTDQVEIEVENVAPMSSQTPLLAPPRVMTKVKLTGRNPLFFELPCDPHHFHTMLTFCMEPASHSMPSAEELPIMGQTLKQLYPDADLKFHLKLYAKPTTSASSVPTLSLSSSTSTDNYGTLVAHFPALSYSEPIIQHLQTKWIDQQVVHQLFCLESTDIKNSRDHFGQLAIKGKISGRCAVFPDEIGNWKAGVFSADEMDGLSLEVVQDFVNKIHQHLYLDETRLRAVIKNIDTTQRTPELDEAFLQLVPRIKPYILKTTGWVQRENG